MTAATSWRWMRRQRCAKRKLRDEPKVVAQALGTRACKTIKGLMWGMRNNPSGWSIKQTPAMHWLQHSGLKSARTWRLKMTSREVYARAAASNEVLLARADLNAWLSWARRSRSEPFKPLVEMITAYRANVFVEAMNGLL